MAAKKEDENLEATLRKQRELMEHYKQASKSAPDKHCKELYSELQERLEEGAHQVALELSRHRMERDLGHSIQSKH